MQVARETAPDFRWPARACGDIALKLERQVGRLFDRLRKERYKRPVVGVSYQGFWGLLAIYVLSVLAAVCYVRFPISPYSFWDVARWGMIPVLFILGAVGLAFSLLNLSMILLVLIYACGHFILSLGYLSWSVLKAAFTRSPWIKSYRWVLPGGLLIATGLAIFIDGSYRFWDKRFVPAVFIATIFVCLSGWSSLFCVVVRDKAFQPNIPFRIVTWTLLLAVPVALLVFWHAGALSSEYFLRKNVLKRPGDKSAWLELAWHYSDKADAFASYEGDADYTPPDPRPYYEKALECFNKAVELGDSRFQTHLARAQVADSLEKKAEAKQYGEIALNLAPPDETQETKDQIKWLREMVARYGDSALIEKEEKERKARIRRERLESLPSVIRSVACFFV